GAITAPRLPFEKSMSRYGSARFLRILLPLLGIRFPRRDQSDCLGIAPGINDNQEMAGSAQSQRYEALFADAIWIVTSNGAIIIEDRRRLRERDAMLRQVRLCLRWIPLYRRWRLYRQTSSSSMRRSLGASAIVTRK